MTPGRSPRSRSASDLRPRRSQAEGSTIEKTLFFEPMRQERKEQEESQKRESVPRKSLGQMLSSKENEKCIAGERQDKKRRGAHAIARVAGARSTNISAPCVCASHLA